VRRQLAFELGLGAVRLEEMDETKQESSKGSHCYGSWSRRASTNPARLLLEANERWIQRALLQRETGLGHLFKTGGETVGVLVAHRLQRAQLGLFRIQISDNRAN
jgi:hypothetical protein